MAIGVKGFHGERLSQAREARGLAANALAELVGVSATAISKYEKKGHSLRPEVLDEIARKLNLPVSFFLKPIVVRPEPKIFYRSMSSATKTARVRAERRYEWFREITDYLSNYFDFPFVNLPELDIPNDFRNTTSSHIESLADQTRAYWNLGYGPIINVVRTLESNGIFVARSNLWAETLDAFSELDHNKQPFIFLSSDNDTMVRSRFNASHELAHLILHKNVEKKSLKKAADFRLIENQAHHFAGAFLIPAKSFVDELVGISLDSFRSLKGRWKIAIAAMIKRCEQLDLISEDQAKRMWINRSRRGWRLHEPLDDLPVEQPQWVKRAFQILVEKKIRSKEQISEDLRLTPTDVIELCSLEENFFNMGLGDESTPVLKSNNQKVVPLRRT